MGRRKDALVDINLAFYDNGVMNDNDKKLEEILEKLNIIEKRVSDIESNVWIIAKFQESPNSLDPLISEVIKFLSKIDSVDAADLQRKFNIGYARAARILDQLIQNDYLEDIGDHNNKRKIIKKNLDALKSKNGEYLKDPLFPKAVKIIKSYESASASLLQRRLMIGYARAARLLDQMEEEGIVGPAIGSRPREVIKNKKN